MNKCLKLLTPTLLVVAVAMFFTSQVEAKWYKGNFHMHTLWSDGGTFPENAIARYQLGGYNFLVTTDHRVFQSDKLVLAPYHKNAYPTPSEENFKGETSRWILLDSKSEPVLELQERFGTNAIKSKTIDGKTYYRLTPFAELKKKFDKKDEFLLIPGLEFNTGAETRTFHFNVINIDAEIIGVHKDLFKDTIRANWELANNKYSSNHTPYFVVANHPLWPYYDISPLHLIANPEVRFFELNNNSLSGKLFSKANPYKLIEGAWNPEKFWDVVNAYRAEANQELLVAIGSDDRHKYAPGELEGKAWSWVDADELSPAGIISAVQQKKIYCSNGLEFESIHFDPKTKTLSVKAKQGTDQKIHIDFIGTKKGYDKTVNEKKFFMPNSNKKYRLVHFFSDDIGKVLKSVDGITAEYKLQADDLYVRARIVTVPTDWNGAVGKCLPRPAAWTQAFK